MYSAFYHVRAAWTVERATSESELGSAGVWLDSRSGHMHTSSASPDARPHADVINLTNGIRLFINSGRLELHRCHDESQYVYPARNKYAADNRLHSRNPCMITVCTICLPQGQHLPAGAWYATLPCTDASYCLGARLSQHPRASLANHRNQQHYWHDLQSSSGTQTFVGPCIALESG